MGSFLTCVFLLFLRQLLPYTLVRVTHRKRGFEGKKAESTGNEWGKHTPLRGQQNEEHVQEEKLALCVCDSLLDCLR